MKSHLYINIFTLSMKHIIYQYPHVFGALSRFGSCLHHFPELTPVPPLPRPLKAPPTSPAAGGVAVSDPGCLRYALARPWAHLDLGWGSAHAAQAPAVHKRPRVAGIGDGIILAYLQMYNFVFCHEIHDVQNRGLVFDKLRLWNRGIRYDHDRTRVASSGDATNCGASSLLRFQARKPGRTTEKAVG